jgi:plastocyanin
MNAQHLARRGSLAIAVVLLGVGFALGDGAAENDVPLVMNELAQAFREMEDGLEADRRADVTGGGTRMGLAALRLATITDEGDPRLALAAPSAARRLGRLANEISELVESNRSEAARQAFIDLRGTCVACHARLRDRDEGRALFPARFATLAGAVSLADLDGRTVADRSRVVVFLESDLPAPAFEPRRDPPEISQEGRQFTPRLLPIVRGTTVRFPNDDSVFHNVFSLSKVNPFDLGIYRQGESREVRFDETGLVKVYCNIHPEMTSSIVVLPNPWYAACAEDGSFVIDDVPAGAYHLRAWTEMGADTSVPVEIADGELLRFELALRETQTPSAHKNKFGREYPHKY